MESYPNKLKNQNLCSIHPAKIAVLRDRSHMFSSARTFFSSRGFVEVDCPIMSSSAAVDAHIDLIPALDVEGKKRYLHSSPEYGMKRLLVAGMGDCYQLSHVFRQGEIGKKHNPEFMMAEWYRLGFDFEPFIYETLSFIRLFLGSLPHEVISYREALQKYAGFDYVKMTTEELIQFLQNKGIVIFQEALKEGKDGLLNLVLACFVEPHLGQDKLCVLSHYPASQAALAKTVQRTDEEVAERFEIYYRGVELANGYHELADPKEQEERFMESNQMREQLGKEPLPIDYNFLDALKNGLPNCCGVAVGFDRLMMLRHHLESLSDVIPFDWNTA